MTTLSTNALSVLTATQGADAAGTGSVLYDSGVTEGSEAALVETFLTDPKALPEAVQVRAQMLMGKLRLGRWTTAGDLRFFDNPQTAMQAARAALEKAGHASPFFVGESAAAPFGEFGQCRADGRVLHVAEEEAARRGREVVMGVPFLEGARLAVGKPVYWMAAGDSPRSGKMSDEEWEEFGKKLDRTLGPVFSKLDSPPASFKKPAVRGSSARVDDATLAAALARHEGNQLQAGKELGQPSWWVSRRVLASKPDSPLWPFHDIKGKKGGSQPQVDDSVLAAALERSRGNRTQAGREVGMTYTAVSQRVLRSAANSPLAGYKSRRIAGPHRTTPRQSADVQPQSPAPPSKKPFLSPRWEGTPSMIRRQQENAALAAALERHQGKITPAAFEVGLSPVVARGRIQKALPDEPLARFQKQSASSHVRKKISDADLAQALEKYEGHRTKAAGDLGINASSVSERISTSRPDSPLWRFRNIGGKADWFKFLKSKVSDGALAEALEKHSGHRENAGQEVGLSGSRVTQRIRAAEPGSVLEPFKTQTYRSTHHFKVSDEQLAAALEKRGGNRVEAAGDVGLSIRTAYFRLQTAKEGSPLIQCRSQSPGKPIGYLPDEKLVEALWRHHGNRSHVARELQTTKATVKRRIRMAGPDSLLAPFKEIKGHSYQARSEAVRPVTSPGTGAGKGKGPVRTRQKKKTAVLTKEQKEGRLSIVAHRLQAAPDLSPLARLAKGRVTDARMAEMLGLYNGSIEAAAPVLGVSPSVIRLRLRLLREHPEWQGQSPLMRYLTLLE